MSLICKLIRHGSFAIFGILAVGVAYYAATLLYSVPNLADRFDASFATLGSLAVPGHFFFAGLALALTPLQLIGAVRRRWPALHRTAGMLCAGAILIAGLSALRLAPEAQYGWVARSGFLTLAVLWIGVTAFAMQRALVGDYAAHGRWMSRSAALTSSAITLRLMLGLGAGLAGLPMEVLYPSVAWGCWLFNLAVVELLLAKPFDRRWGLSLRTA